MMHVYCIRDVVAGFSMAPVISETDMTFMRMVRGEVETASEKSNIRRFPNDFALVLIGEWDPETGVLIGYPDPRTLGRVSDFVAPSPSVDNTVSSVPAALNP